MNSVIFQCWLCTGITEVIHVHWVADPSYPTHPPRNYVIGAAREWDFGFSLSFSGDSNMQPMGEAVKGKYTKVAQLFFFFFCQILVPPPGIDPKPSARKVLSPNHWTTREFPHLITSKSNWDPLGQPLKGTANSTQVPRLYIYVLSDPSHT